MSRTRDEIEPKSDEIHKVGDFTISVKTRELTDAAGQVVALRSQSADVLLYLAAHAGELVTKDALIDAVWGDTFVTDDSLVQCIGDIRKALSDDTREIVQTVPRKGYRLVAAPGAPTTVDARPRRRAVAVLGGVAMVVLIAVLVWINAGAPAPEHPRGDKPKIAVLPFDDFSAGEEKGYLSDAIAEGIITELARNSRVAVIARNSSFRYRGGDTDIRQIGEELGVHYVVEGSQQKNGDALKVTVQLISAASGEHLWAHTYDQAIGDLFAVQDAIIKTVADRIGVRIERPVPGADPDKVSALHYHLQGLEIVRKEFNEDGNARDFELNRKAIQADPDSQFGYIGLAHAYRAAATFGWQGLDRDEALRLGFENAEKALEIAPDDAGVHYVMARLHAENGDRARSIASYDKAIALNPSASNYLVGSTTPLLYAGQTEDAIRRLERAMGIDPFHPDWYHWQMGWALWETEDCDGALAAMLKMKKIPRGAQRQMAGIYACLGDVGKAREAYETFYSEADEPTITQEREKWAGIWTAPGSLDRWLSHMRLAGMRD